MFMEKRQLAGEFYCSPIAGGLLAEWSVVAKQLLLLHVLRNKEETLFRKLAILAVTCRPRVLSGRSLASGY